VSSEAAAASPEPAPAGSGAPIFEYQLRREGRIVATIRGVQAGGGFTVETEVHPASAKAGSPPVSRPFPFPTLDHARRFADEALVALEYLNCSVV
jgi:hypothetical protein